MSNDRHAIEFVPTYFMELAAKGVKARKIPVLNSATAVGIFEKFRDHGGKFGQGFGASELRGNCGEITDANGKRIANICYNGRVALLNGSFLDGLDTTEWVDLCSGRTTASR